MAGVSAVVPAAGLSSRMEGPNKLLLPWEGGTVVGAVASCLLSCGLDVVVVTGRDAEAVREAVAPARTVFNPDFAEGLGRSISAGVGACPKADGWMIALGDMPGLNLSVVKLLLSRFASAGSDAIVAPVYSAEPERHGQPVLFGVAYRDELLALSDDIGARTVVARHLDLLVSVVAKGSLGDIDVPGDVAK